MRRKARINSSRPSLVGSARRSDEVSVLVSILDLFDFTSARTFWKDVISAPLRELIELCFHAGWKISSS
jgi:hypothetical protein